MKLIVALSGGVDSSVMLDVLVREAVHELFVVHVDHGIRLDSSEDEALAKKMAEQHSLPFQSIQANLGANTSEDEARIVRHDALRAMKYQLGADAIATAHHFDDVIETMIINMVRGTGWRGLCSLRETNEYTRPLISWSKQQVVEYAIDHDLVWHEDSTNDDMKYLRNYLRHGVAARLTERDRRDFAKLYKRSCKLRDAIEKEAQQYLKGNSYSGKLQRFSIIMLEESVAVEVLRSWLGFGLERRRLSDLWLFAKTARAGAKWSLDQQRFVVADAEHLIVASSFD